MKPVSIKTQQLMDRTFEYIQTKFETLVSGDYVLFSHVVSLKNITGVYIICNEQKEIIYIGHTNKFNIRFGTDLKHETTHTLVNKLIRNGQFANRYEVVDFLKTKCYFKIEPCNNKREAEALECMAIYILQPEFNK